ncbi:MAG: T9SS type A sorting domain-containing protein [Flavobacteriales bacterium]|nr:T9SS type A sorting domain-containing protein [Flavobacteriales bacterium]
MKWYIPFVLSMPLFISANKANAQCPHTIASTGQNPVCANDSIKLDATPLGDTFLWYRNGVPVNGATDSYLFVNTPGVYNCMVGQTCGTDSAATGIAVSVNNIPSVSIMPATDTTYCPGESVQLSASTGGTSQWYMNGNPISGAVSPVYDTSQAGWYNMTKTNSKGCSDSAAVGVAVTLTVIHAPIIQASEDTVNLSVSGTVDFSLLTSGYDSVAWDFGDGDTSVATAPSHTYTTPGAYQVTVMVYVNGCEDFAIANVWVVNTTGIVYAGVNTESVRVFPNPTSYSLHWDQAGLLSWQVFDSAGQLVISGTKGEAELNMLPSGVYLIRFAEIGGAYHYARFSKLP